MEVFVLEIFMLPREYKLKKDNDFKKVFEKGKFYRNDFIKIRFLKNDLEITRFGIIISSKISKKAVCRNRIRRRLEETIRLRLDQIKSGFDIVVLFGPEVVDKNYKQIEETFVGLVEKAKLIN